MSISKHLIILIIYVFSIESKAQKIPLGSYCEYSGYYCFQLNEDSSFFYKKVNVQHDSIGVGSYTYSHDTLILNFIDYNNCSSYYKQRKSYCLHNDSIKLDFIIYDAKTGFETFSEIKISQYSNGEKDTLKLESGYNSSITEFKLARDKNQITATVKHPHYKTCNINTELFKCQKIEVVLVPTLYYIRDDFSYQEYQRGIIAGTINVKTMKNIQRKLKILKVKKKKIVVKDTYLNKKLVLRLVEHWKPKNFVIPLEMDWLQRNR